MSDLTNAKDIYGGKVYIENEVESPFVRTGPLITPERLRMNFLLGIPLVGFIKDPITKQFPVITDDILASIINRAVTTAEMETGLIIFPTEINDKYPFHRPDYDSFSYFRVKNTPLSKIIKLAITPANNLDIYIIPNDWISFEDTTRINVIPINTSLVTGGAIPENTATGSAFLSVMGRSWYTPAFWSLDAIYGFDEGKIPTVINEVIGIIAALDVLSQLAATFRTTSNSLSIDGTSQSASGPGPNIYAIRIKDLMDKKKDLVKKIKHEYGLGTFSADL